MGYLLTVIARIFGRAFAPQLEQGFDKVVGTHPDRVARKRKFQPMVPLAKDSPTVGEDGQLRPWLPGEWERTRTDRSARAGSVLSDWELTEVLMAEREAAGEASRLAYMTKVQAVFEPLVPEMKASMTPEEWEARRASVTTGLHRDRLESGWPIGGAAEDWRIAKDLSPIRLDLHGNAIPD